MEEFYRSYVRQEDTFEKVKIKLYISVISLVMTYESNCWVIKTQYVQRISVVENEDVYLVEWSHKN